MKRSAIVLAWVVACGLMLSCVSTAMAQEANPPATEPAKPAAPAKVTPDGAAQTAGADWFQFLGPNRNGVSEGPKLAASWGPSGPPVVWKTDCQVGFSGPMVKDGMVVIMERGPKPEGKLKVASTDDVGTNAVPKLPGETVRVLNAKNGVELWRSNTFPCEAMDPDSYYWGSCATPAGVQDRVVCQFLDGNVRCFELKTGKLLWTRDLNAEFGMTKKGYHPPYQACSSPLVAGEQVVFMVCTGKIGLLSLSVADGQEVWHTPPFDNYGSSTGFTKMGDTNIVIAVSCKANSKLFGDGSVLGFNALNGKLLWCGNAGNNGYNAPEPIANEGILVVEGGGGDGPTVAFSLPAAGDSKALELWKDNDHLARFSNYLVYRGLVFGEGYTAHGSKAGTRLFCDEARSGKNLWFDRVNERHHSLIGSDGKVFQLHENGELAVFDASVSDGYKELARARVVQQKKGVWSFPALVNGRLYVRTDSEVVCLDLTAK